MPADALDGLIAKIEAASLLPAPWSSLLVDISAFAGARGALVLPLSGDRHRLEATESMDAMLHTYLADGWASNDFRYRGMLPLLRRGITVDQDFVDADTMRKEPYYESFLARHGLRYFAGLGLHTGRESWVLTLQRRETEGPFDPAEQARLVLLAGALQRALAVSRALSAAHAIGCVDGLSLRGTACLLLDRLGRVGYLNAAAEQLVGRVFDVQQGRLTFRSRQTTSEVGLRIQAALGVTAGQAPAEPYVARDEQTSHLVKVVRLEGLYDSIFKPYHALVEISSVAADVVVDRATVSRAYGLSKREGDVLDALLQTTNLVAAAKSLGLAHETARSHMKAVYAKTGTSNQAQVVALMASLAAARPPGA